LVPRAPARVSREVAVREVFYVNRTAAHWVHRGSRRVPFSKHARRCSRLTVHSVRSKTEIILHASLLFRAPSLGSLAIHLSTNGSPALGFPSLFAASPERSYVSSRGIPCPASIRPQVFATSRRFLLLSGLRACFIPQPRSGFFVVQGLLSRRSRPSSSEGVTSLPLLHRRSPARSDFRRFELSSTCDASRLRGLHPRQAAFIRVWLFTAPKAAPLIEFYAPPGPRSLDDDLRSHGDHPLLMLRAGLHLRADQSNAHVRVHVPTFACSLEGHVRVWAFRRTRSCFDRARILGSLWCSKSSKLLPQLHRLRSPHRRSCSPRYRHNEARSSARVIESARIGFDTGFRRSLACLRHRRCPLCKRTRQCAAE
jgi:hypothetical protein